MSSRSGPRARPAPPNLQQKGSNHFCCNDLPEAKIRAVVQRVRRCSVEIDGALHSEIGVGLLVLLGVGRSDTEGEARYLSDKVLNLRIFPDEEKKMNLSVVDVGGQVMVVSQFTLLADCRKGRRPSFVEAAEPAAAESLYERFCEMVSEGGVEVRKGVFGAMMDVTLDNWGPVTIVIDTP